MTTFNTISKYTQNDCTRNPDRCKDNGVCIANYTSGGSSCAKTRK